jgi:hypothetical protein
MFLGHLNLKAVTDFIRKIDLLAMNSGLRPGLYDAHDHELIRMAIGWFSKEAMEWLTAELTANHISLEVALDRGFPFSWKELSEAMLARFAPANAIEGCWTELAALNRRQYATIHLGL